MCWFVVHDVSGRKSSNSIYETSISLFFLLFFTNLLHLFLLLHFNLIISSGECCQSTCGTAFFGRSLTCPSGSAPKSSDSPCGVVDASGACQASNVKSVNGVLQNINGCCKVTCAAAMSVLEAAGKCGGNRAAAKSDSTDSCANDECDEATCCPMLCENAGLTCSLPAEVPKDKECSETSIDVNEQCSAAAGGGCACVETCRSWGANGGTCSSPKILDTIDNQACTTKGGACSEQICCVDPPACGTDFKGTAITSACTCGSSSCEVGKFCFNPSDVEGILQNEFTCSATAAPARCGRKTDPSSYSSFTCDAGTEKVEDDVASQCAMDNSCTKEKCCGPRTCTGKNIFFCAHVSCHRDIVSSSTCNFLNFSFSRTDGFFFFFRSNFF